MAERTWTATALRAERYRLTACDAASVELVLRPALPPVSTDRALVTAAREAGVGLVIAA